MKKLLMASVMGVGLLSGLASAALAQSADPEVQQLEEQVRQLNGRIEEMSFQLLQMQEQMRKTQEDNEFRFQELEKGGTKKKSSLEQPAGGANSAATADAGAGTGTSASGGTAGKAPAGSKASNGTDITTVIEQSGAGSGASAGDASGTAPAAGDLGSINLDANGNPIGVTTAPGAANGANAAGTAAASAGGTAAGGAESDSYQVAYGHVLGGDYAQAEQEFRTYIANYPQGKKIADANFWLGEAYYSQGKYNDAAKTFLKAHKTYGSSPKAPEMLLKLGMSLGALDQNEAACATFREVTKRYPKASRTVINKVASEEKRLAC